MIKNDRNHGAGKGSPGAIMGCKNLKAIAVRGTGDVAIAHRPTFLETVAQWEANLFVADATMQNLTLTNSAAQTNILVLNTKKPLEVPIQ